MASPGTLRLLTALSEGELDEVRPTLDVETGDVAYPDADGYLDDYDGDTFETLETLAERGLLHREFQEKQYVCPQCETKGMQYTTACPTCESPRTVRTERYRHPDCGYEGPREGFVDGDDVVCPECETELESIRNLETDAASVCEACETVFETPEHRLRCRECHAVVPPLHAIERVLYRYYGSDRGDRLVEELTTARRSVAELFEERKLETEVDTTVTDSSGTEVPVHVYARDELLNDRVVGAVHEHPDNDDVRALRSLASDLDARATLVTTSGKLVGTDVSEETSSDGLTVLSHRNGTLAPEYEVTGEFEASDSFVGRIAGIFKAQRE